MRSKEFLSGSSKKVIMDCCIKHKWDFWDEFTHLQEFSNKLLYRFHLRIFLCHRKLHCAHKYPIADFQKTMLAHWTLKRNVYLQVLNSHIEMQFLRTLLSAFDLRIFPFSPQPSVRSYISLCRTQNNRVIKRFQEGKGETLGDEVTHQKAISQ